MRNSEEKKNIFMIKSFEDSPENWLSIDQNETKKLVAASKEYMKKKDSELHLRVNSQLLQKIKEFALQEGIPYQTFISSVLHKYVTAQLIEKKILTFLLNKKFKHN